MELLVVVCRCSSCTLLCSQNMQQREQIFVGFLALVSIEQNTRGSMEVRGAPWKQT